MRLEGLYQDFSRMSPEEQASFISSYRLRRATELASTTPLKLPAAKIKTKVELSDEEKAIMKLLGLKQKDVLALRNNNVTEPVEDDKEAANLFKDDTFEEGDD